MGGYGGASSSSGGSGHGTFSPPYRGGGASSSNPYSSVHGSSSLISSATTVPSASIHNSLILQGTPRATAGSGRGSKSTTFVCDIDAVCKVIQTLLLCALDTDAQTNHHIVRANVCLFAFVYFCLASRPRVTVVRSST